MKSSIKRYEEFSALLKKWGVHSSGIYRDRKPDGTLSVKVGSYGCCGPMVETHMLSQRERAQLRKLADGVQKINNLAGEERYEFKDIPYQQIYRYNVEAWDEDMTEEQAKKFTIRMRRAAGVPPIRKDSPALLWEEITWTQMQKIKRKVAQVNKALNINVDVWHETLVGRHRLTLVYQLGPNGISLRLEEEFDKAVGVPAWAAGTMLGTGHRDMEWEFPSLAQARGAKKRLEALLKKKEVGVIEVLANTVFEEDE